MKGNMKTKIGHMFRQGDVLITRVKSMPEKLRPVDNENNRVVLAHGEVTGHTHSIASTDAVQYVDDSGATFLEVTAAMAALEHQEHSTISLDQGTYKITRQREYSPEAIRRVAD